MGHGHSHHHGHHLKSEPLEHLFAKKGQHRKFKKDDAMIKAGKECESIYIVLTGSIKLVLQKEGQPDRDLGIRGSGEVRRASRSNGEL